MESSIIISGFGGQGALFAGQLLAYAGMDAGRFVSWIPSYGPEMRGGTAHCTVIIGDDEIGAPIVARPDAVVALNLPSYDKYEPLVKPGGRRPAGRGCGRCWPRPRRYAVPRRRSRRRCREWPGIAVGWSGRRSGRR